jgi:glycosyltransferase involved in cell wall biosynthesis
MNIFSPAPLRPAAYSSLEGKRIILFVGRITEAKGTYNLIDAFRDQVAPRFAAAALVLIGEPEVPDRLRRALAGIEGRVVHLNQVERKELPPFYSHAYVFVGPSRREPFGLVFVEALACGLPVISVAEGGPLEIIEPGATGLLCPDNSAGSIAEALESLLRDSDLRDRMSRSARSSVVGRFGIEGVGADLVSMYREVVGRRRGESSPLASELNAR